QFGRFFHNVGGRFRDETVPAGFSPTRPDAPGVDGKTLGVAVADYDGDGRPDLYLANDGVPCNMFRNAGRARFENAGLLAGTAYNSAGNTQAGMGCDWGDYDGDGWPDLVVTT
ncbi:MAG: CRTAC1 family protein, partial [Chloroflexota bacterium]